MKLRHLAIAFAATALVGCGIGRVVTAPVRYVFHEPEPPPTSASDVTNPGHPVTVASPTPTRTVSRKTTRPGTQPRARRIADKTGKPTASPTKTVSSIQFPVAKPVPGKPGLVFNPFNASAGYIDVSGYAPGSKVKDPETKQIFVVP
jgi:hypothetical protein